MTDSRDVLLFGALALVWGTSFTAIEIGLESLPPLLFAALRFDVAALCFVAVVVAFGHPWRPQTGGDWALIAVGGVVLVGAHYALLFLGQATVSSAVAAIVLSLVPIVTPPLALAVVPGVRVRAPAVAGLLVGLLGVVLVALSSGSLGGSLLGVGLLVASAVAFALGTVLAERVSGSLPLVSVQAWAMAVGALCLHAVSVAHPGESLAGIEWSLTALGALAYLGVVATAGAFVVYFVLLERLGSSELTMVNYAVPVVAAGFGWALLGETITAATVVGFAAIVLGFALCKVDVLWQRGAPVVGYGPYRPVSVETDECVVNGNVYLASGAGSTPRGHSRGIVSDD
ncbi:DMT family transporter [Natronobiforma cellulositropha]|uniref:DMT family transporter n=1 Tax=Natronobiforma cellulositropha TaxID=1679076 RepID=UPI0021D5D99C|nr:DMT family transporter [Natronobiforma cellulositropha]